MTIPLVDPDDIRIGRGRCNGKNKYQKYGIAIWPYITFLKQQIESSKDGHIRIKTAEIACTMNMCGKHPTTIYWGLKYNLFQEGIVVGEGQTREGESILLMRFKKDEDILPDSLKKYLEE